jgi:hypothetical protein
MTIFFIGRLTDSIYGKDKRIQSATDGLIGCVLIGKQMAIGAGYDPNLFFMGICDHVKS